RRGRPRRKPAPFPAGPPLPVKAKDRRSAGFIRQHGRDCAEVDALAPSELRNRVEDAILAHIDAAEWERLQEAERLEQETLEEFVRNWDGTAPTGKGETKGRERRRWRR